MDTLQQVTPSIPKHSGAVSPKIGERPGRALSSALLSALYVQERREMRLRIQQLADSLTKGQGERVRASLADLAKWLAPRFQYEERDLYPCLEPALGHSYLQTLREDHEGSVEILGLLQELTSLDSLNARDRMEGAALVKRLMDHAFRSCGLCLLIEDLPDETARKILAARAGALGRGVGLQKWDREQRTRSNHDADSAYPGGKWPSERIASRA